VSGLQRSKGLIPFVEIWKDRELRNQLPLKIGGSRMEYCTKSGLFHRSSSYPTQLGDQLYSILITKVEIE
jgi:hypothetical protein